MKKITIKSLSRKTFKNLTLKVSKIKTKYFQIKKNGHYYYKYFFYILFKMYGNKINHEYCT